MTSLRMHRFRGHHASTSILKSRQSSSVSKSSSICRPYTFHIAANWAGKPATKKERELNRPFPPTSPIGQWRDRMLSNRQYRAGIEHQWVEKARSAGEDFFYVQEMKNGSGVSFGVADGVGGWILNDVDPSLFAQALMYHAHRYTRNGWAGEPEIDPTLDYEEREQVEGWEITPYECLDLAYGGVLRERHVEAGSSTACLLTLNASSGLLRAANLGDSGFSIIRSSSIFYRQAVQTHFFNCPKQLTKMPKMGKRGRFSRACDDPPSEADTYRTTLRDGDIIVAYTDGFSDNVFPSEMLTICSLVSRSNISEDEKVFRMAERMVDYARDCMFKRNKPSPFEREAAREGMFFQGGKIDDVTVVVALVRETS